MVWSEIHNGRGKKRQDACYNHLQSCILYFSLTNHLPLSTQVLLKDILLIIQMWVYIHQIVGVGSVGDNLLSQLYLVPNLRSYPSLQFWHISVVRPVEKRSMIYSLVIRKYLLLPPQQVDKLLPWYMQWSHDLAAEMHCRCLVWNKAHHTGTNSLSHECFCDLEWWCKLHNTCFIHNSCFCPGSGAFPPVKPPHT